MAGEAQYDQMITQDKSTSSPCQKVPTEDTSAMIFESFWPQPNLSSLESTVNKSESALKYVSSQYRVLLLQWISSKVWVGQFQQYLVPRRLYPCFNTSTVIFTVPLNWVHARYLQSYFNLNHNFMDYFGHSSQYLPHSWLLKC